MPPLDAVLLWSWIRSPALPVDFGHEAVLPEEGTPLPGPEESYEALRSGVDLSVLIQQRSDRVPRRKVQSIGEADRAYPIGRDRVRAVDDCRVGLAELDLGIRGGGSRMLEASAALRKPDARVELGELEARSGALERPETFRFSLNLSTASRASGS